MKYGRNLGHKDFEMKQVYQTIDGKTFNSESDALAYEKKLEKDKEVNQIKRGLDNIIDDTDEISLNLRKKNII
jgi:hypothetical protein